MSINSSDSLTADIDTRKSAFVSHSVHKPEYKEYAFQAERNETQNSNIKTKVATFWKEMDRNNYEAPQSTIFKTKFIQECVDNNDTDYDTSQEESTSFNEDEKKRISLMNQKWTHTLCLFKKRGLDKLALAARPKLCNRCDPKFMLEYSDEDCNTFIADYGDEEVSSADVSASY